MQSVEDVLSGECGYAVGGDGGGDEVEIPGEVEKSFWTTT